MLNGTTFLVFIFEIINDMPNPIIKLKIGLENIPVMAIFEYPFFAIVKSANKSPTQFPKARITIPI